MRLAIPFVFLVALVAVVTTSTACNSGEGGRVEADEMAVYLAIVRSDHSKAIVVSSDAIRAFGITEAENVRSLLPSAPESAIRDFLDKNQKDLILKEDVTVDGGFNILGSIERNDRLLRFDRYHVVSRVGFDAARKKAIVYYFESCDLLCSEGSFFLLEYQKGKWIKILESDKIRT